MSEVYPNGLRSMEKMRTIGNKVSEYIKAISTKSGIKEALSYEGVSLWWFYEFELYYLIKDHIKTKRDNDQDAPKKDTPRIISRFRNYYIISRAITRFIFGKIIYTNKSRKNNQSENGSTHKILVASYTNYWKDYRAPQKDDKKRNRDGILGDIIAALQNKETFNVVAVDQDTTFFVDFKTMIEKRTQGKRLWRPVEAYLTFDIIRKVFEAAKKYEKEWGKFKNNEEFIDSLNEDYNGIPLSGFLKDYFRELFKYGTFSPVLDIELMKRAIEVENPDLILISCGYCLLGRAATIAGRLRGVPTLEIQHGIITPTHIGYLFAKNEISHDGSVNPSYCPVPDKTAVYGYCHRYILTNISAYPEDSVVVTGQPRYDILADADKIYCREKFVKEYGINQNHKIVLWTTQCHAISDDENIRNFDTVFRSMQNLRDVTLVIKQHPGEGKRYTRMITNYLKMYKLSAVITPKSSDTYELLFVCDLMITKHSTTAMEAVALNKPVIVLNLSGEADVVDYVEQGVALGVYNVNDLEPIIEKLLKDDIDLAKSRKSYIEKNLCKADGKATERIVGLVEMMIGESRKEKNQI